MRAVLFDLDGTLVDTIDLIRQSFHAAFQTLRLERPPDESFVSTIGLPLRVQFQRITLDPAHVDPLIGAYREHYLQHHNDMIQVYEGITSVLTEIARRGIAMGVVTGKVQAGAQRTLGAAELAGFFSVVVGADDVSNPKPHPEPVHEALRELDVASDEACIVGDSIYDMQAGAAAGVHTVAALWGPGDRDAMAPAKPGTWAKTPAEILDLLDPSR